jgi:[ribosomal protein S18]-alanine N-acetyltransferase
VTAAPRAERRDLPVDIGPMRRRQVPAVLRIERQVYPKPWTASLYLGELSLPSTRVYRVARLGGRVVGYGGLMVALDQGHVTTLAVDPAHHGRHVGTRLLVELCRRAAEREVAEITLEVRASNEAAQGLYRKFGFAAVGRRRNYYPEVNEDAVVMTVEGVDAPGFLRRLVAIEDALGVVAGRERDGEG